MWAATLLLAWSQVTAVAQENTSSASFQSTEQQSHEDKPRRAWENRAGRFACELEPGCDQRI